MKSIGYISALSLCAISAVLSGCTHLEVNRYKPDLDDSRSGIAYMLNFTQYEVEVTRTLIACKAGDLPEVKTEAKVTTSIVPDGDHVYTIDPSSMVSAFKTSDVLVTMEKGRLVTFNAKVEGKEGEFISSVVSSAGKIARLASGVGVNVSAAGNKTVCSDEAIANLALVENNTKPIGAATAKLEAANLELLDLTVQYAAKPTMKLSKKIKTKTAAIAAAKKQLDRMSKASEEAQTWLTEVRTLRWPEQSTVFHEVGASPLSMASVSKWFRIDAIREALGKQDHTWLTSNQDGTITLVMAGTGGAATALGISVEEFQQRFPNLQEGKDISKCATEMASPCGVDFGRLQSNAVDIEFFRKIRASIDLHIIRRGSYGSEAVSEGVDKPKDGLRYRLPAAGAFYICGFDEPCQEGKPWQPIAAVQTSVAQLGTVFNLPFSSPAFASGSLSAAFDNEGWPSSVGLKRENSTALAAANAVGGVIDEAAKVKSAQDGAELEKLKKATEIATQKKTLADAIAELSPDESKDLTRQLAIAKLKIDLKDANAKLIDDPNADLAIVKAKYEAETSVLTAKKASLEAEAATIAAEEALKKAKAGS